MLQTSRVLFRCNQRLFTSHAKTWLHTPGPLSSTLSIQNTESGAAGRHYLRLPRHLRRTIACHDIPVINRAFQDTELICSTTRNLRTTSRMDVEGLGICVRLPCKPNAVHITHAHNRHRIFHTRGLVQNRIATRPTPTRPHIESGRTLRELKIGTPFFVVVAQAEHSQ
jgi:hypothetical protein